jgi:2,4-dichlorophenol 6-monooxygenase
VSDDSSSLCHLLNNVATACGLNLSIFLSNLGVNHVLFERHPGTSVLPKAHIINQRTMEIFRQHGIAESILAQGTPPRQMSQVVWQTSLAGEGPLDRKVLGAIRTWGCQEDSEQNSIYQ